MPNFDLYPECDLDAEQILGFGFDRVVLATGGRWLPMLYHPLEVPVPAPEGAPIFTPDDIAAGRMPNGPTVLLDFDGHVMGGALAEHLAGQGLPITYVTPA